MTLCQQIADGKQFFPLRHVNAGKYQQLFRGEMEVEARPRRFAEILEIEGGRDVSFIRTLVFGEPRVPINSEHSLLHRGYVSWSKFGEFGIDRAHQCLERSANMLFIHRFARLEPFALVVAFQSAKECDCLGRETGKAALRDGLSAYGQGSCSARHV